MQNLRKLWAFLFLAVLLVAVQGCGSGGSSSLNPQFQPQVSNLVDNFQFQSTGVTNVTETLTYTWANSGIAATVNQATTVTAGTAVVMIKDANGTQVYSAGLQNNGTFDTATGITGNWQIVVVLSNYSGTLNFRVQKK